MIKVLFDNIGKYRTALMGLSMILVFMSHAQSEKLGFLPTGVLGVVCKNGYLGVDIFLFLSAFGLCFSLKKNNLKRFYYNRLKRIMPTWWVVLFFVHIAGVLFSSRFTNGSFVYPHSIVEMFYWYTGLGFFFDTCCYEWYIPTLLLFYLLIPAIYRLSRNVVLLIIFISIPVIVLYTECRMLPHLTLSISRIPVFLIGVLYFKDSEQNNYNLFLISCIFIFLYTFILTSFWNVPTVIFYASMFPILSGLISLILSSKFSYYIEVFLSFVGTISLEFYLIHLYRRPQFLLSYIIKNDGIQVLGAFVICLVLSYILHLLIKKVNENFLFPNYK